MKTDNFGKQEELAGFFHESCSEGGKELCGHTGSNCTNSKKRRQHTEPHNRILSFQKIRRESTYPLLEGGDGDTERVSVG